MEVKNPTEIRKLTKNRKRYGSFRPPVPAIKMALLIKGTAVLYNNGGG